MIICLPITAAAERAGSPVGAAAALRLLPVAVGVRCAAWRRGEQAHLAVHACVRRLWERRPTWDVEDLLHGRGDGHGALGASRHLPNDSVRR